MFSRLDHFYSYVMFSSLWVYNQLLHIYWLTAAVVIMLSQFLWIQNSELSEILKLWLQPRSLRMPDVGRRCGHWKARSDPHGWQASAPPGTSPWVWHASRVSSCHNVHQINTPGDQSSICNAFMPLETSYLHFHHSLLWNRHILYVNPNLVW